MSDAFADGHRFRILAIVDDLTRKCLALVADTSLSPIAIARELDGLVAQQPGVSPRASTGLRERVCEKVRIGTDGVDRGIAARRLGWAPVEVNPEKQCKKLR